MVVWTRGMTRARGSVLPSLRGFPRSEKRRRPFELDVFRADRWTGSRARVAATGWVGRSGSDVGSRIRDSGVAGSAARGHLESAHPACAISNGMITRRRKPRALPSLPPSRYGFVCSSGPV